MQERIRPERIRVREQGLKRRPERQHQPDREVQPILPERERLPLMLEGLLTIKQPLQIKRLALHHHAPARQPQNPPILQHHLHRQPLRIHQILPNHLLPNQQARRHPRPQSQGTEERHLPGGRNTAA